MIHNLLFNAIPIRQYSILFLLAIVIVISTGCRKLVAIDPPPTSQTSDNVYNNDATASAVFIGLYSSFSNLNPVRALTIGSISLATGLSADELTLFGGSGNANQSLVQFYQNKLIAGLSSSSAYSLWSDFYSKIYIVNIALERLTVSAGLTPAVKEHLIGEAKFLRAFFYFYLVNLYGDVPLTTMGDYRVNSTIARSPKADVYKQIIRDLKDAQVMLPDGYVGADAKTVTSERVRPNKWAATALLARVYLYTSQWSDAEAQATSIINNRVKYDTTLLNNVFLRNSSEAIWQLQPVNAGWNTEDAQAFILPPSGPTANSTSEGYPVYLSPQLVSAFETNDQRKINWTGSVTIYNYPFKYKSATINAPVTEYLMVLRLAEQYLIRAEARTRQNKTTGAKTDLNVIRTRARLPNTTANDETSLLNAILHERQVELFTEWGNRWLDLKRTNNIDQVMSAVAPTKGTTWIPNWALYPLPLYDIIQNQNLVQNAGY
jgi:hypothetical protein